MARVQITLEISGNVVDVADVDLPDGVLLAAVDAMAAKFGYAEDVPNPDFDNSVEESEDNPRLIANPMSKWRHFSYQLRLYAQDVARAEFIRQGQVAANAAVESQFTGLLSQIVVKE